jgi:predicted metalloprotease
MSETVCTQTGTRTLPGESSTSDASEEVECAQCRVGVDLLLEAGDIFLTEDGHWEAETRPEEFRSVYNFIKYLGDDERKGFTLEELQELVSNSGRPYQETLMELRRLGFRIIRPPIEREVRGVGRSKNTRD